jgi:hypothetical protein
MIKALDLFCSRQAVQQQWYQNPGGEKSDCIPDILAGKQSGVGFCIVYAAAWLARAAFMIIGFR